MNPHLRSVLSAGALCLPLAVLAQGAPSSHSAGSKHAGAAPAVVTQAKDLKWMPAPPSVPPGAQMAILDGDPAKPGAFTMRVRFPANYRVAPHHHPSDERVTVVSGALRVGMGERFDEAGMTALSEGGFFSMPKGHRHYVLTSEETILQVHATGPWDVIYVNPADDPRRQKKAQGAAPKR